MIKQFVKILEIGRLYKCSFFNNTITLLGLENSEDLRRFKESFEAKRGPYDDDASGFGHRIMTAMDQNVDRTGLAAGWLNRAKGLPKNCGACARHILIS